MWLCTLLLVSARIREISSPLGTLKFDPTTGRALPTPPLHLPRSSNVSFPLSVDVEEDADAAASAPIARRLQQASTCIPQINVGVHVAPSFLRYMTRTQLEQYVHLVIDAVSALWAEQQLGVVRVEYIDMLPEGLIDQYNACDTLAPTAAYRDAYRTNRTADVVSVWAPNAPCNSRSNGISTLCSYGAEIQFNNVNGLGQGLGDVGVFAHELGHAASLQHTWVDIPGCQTVESCYQFAPGISYVPTTDDPACIEVCESNRKNGCTTIMSYDAFCTPLKLEEPGYQGPGFEGLRYHADNVQRVQQFLGAGSCGCAAEKNAFCLMSDSTQYRSLLAPHDTPLSMQDIFAVFYHILGRSTNERVDACADYDDSGSVQMNDLFNLFYVLLGRQAPAVHY